MPSLDSRNRMISFRLSVEEYEKFRELCLANGIRSLSEMARVAINNFLNQTPQTAAQTSLDARVSDLEARLHVLSNELKRQKSLIDDRHA
jgi:hypothetical protein